MEGEEHLTEIYGEEWYALLDEFKGRTYTPFEPILSYWGTHGALVPLFYWYYDPKNKEHIAWSPNKVKVVIHQFIPLEKHWNLVGTRVRRKKKENGDNN